MVQSGVCLLCATYPPCICLLTEGGRAIESSMLQYPSRRRQVWHCNRTERIIQWYSTQPAWETCMPAVASRPMPVFRFAVLRLPFHKEANDSRRARIYSLASVRRERSPLSLIVRSFHDNNDTSAGPPVHTSPISDTNTSKRLPAVDGGDGSPDSQSTLRMLLPTKSPRCTTCRNVSLLSLSRLLTY